LTLDEDVAEKLEWIRNERKLTLRDAANEAMRKGLAAMAEPGKQKRRFRTPVFHGGEWLLPDGIVSTHDMLAWAEGEMYR
jgi:hypothetical protein